MKSKLCWYKLLLVLQRKHMGSSSSCHNRQEHSLRVVDGFHSPTLICSDPKTLVFPRNTLRLEPIYHSDSDDSREGYRERRRRLSSSSPSQRRGSRFYHRSPREEPEEDLLQIKRTYGSTQLSVKVPGKTVHFKTPGAPRDNKLTRNRASYDNSGDHWGETPWAPPEHVAVTYSPRRRGSRRSRRWEDRFRLSLTEPSQISANKIAIYLLYKFKT